MKVVITVASLSARFGGPSRSVPALCDALVKQNVTVDLIALRETNETSADEGSFSRTLINTKSNRYHPLDRSRPFRKAISDAVRLNKEVVLHDNGVWLPTNYFAAKCARDCRVPLVVTPRGMLSSWALNTSRWKKRLAWLLYQKRCLTTAQVLHATSSAEAAGFRTLGLTQAIAVIPNGTDFPIGEQRAGSREQRANVRTVLFLSRIHGVKGLMNLMKAWAVIAKSKEQGAEGKAQNEEWRLLIVGPDEDGHTEELKAEIRRLKLERSIEFQGEVNDERKWKLMAAADLFVLPSHSENFGIVIAEALASGIPVITTRGTPWEDLQTHRCGWWTEIGTEPLVNALVEAMALSDQERSEMGKRGRCLVEQKYSWDNAARQMKTVYEWILGKGPKPACVV